MDKITTLEANKLEAKMSVGTNEDINTGEKKEPEKTEHPVLDNLEHLTEKDKQVYEELRRENAKRRIRNKELEKEINDIQSKIKKQEENKLKEDGKLKELLEAKEKELEEMQPLKDELEQYKLLLSEQLEAELKKLPAKQRDLITESTLSQVEKIKWAKTLSESVRTQGDSPDSARPGGDVPLPDIKLSDYEGPEGRKKLIEIRNTKPKLYDEILKLKGTKAKKY